MGLQPTGGNAATRLYIGSTVIAVSNDNSNNAAYSFAQFNGAGGLPKFTFSSSSATICYGTSLTATISPTDNVISFDCFWSVDNGGSITPASTLAFATAQTATITPTSSASAKTYIITCTVKGAGDTDPITTQTVSVTVNPAPAAPSSTTATPAAICIGSSANVKATSAGNTIQWYTVSSGGTTIGSSASATDFSVPPASTATYYAEAKISATGCTSTSRGSATVTVSPNSAGGTISGSNTVCSGSNSSTLTLSGHTGTVTQWQSSTDNFATAATNISNTTTSLTINNLSTTTFYRAVVTSGACSSANSAVTALTVSNPGTWLGVNTDRNSSLNWCNGSIPTSSTNIVIPNGLSFYPVVGTTALANNITVATGGSATITVTGTLKVAGSITSTNGINVTAGTIELIGAAGQSVRADNFVSATVANFKVSNTLSSASSVNPSAAINAAGGMLKVSGMVSFGNLNNAYLQTNDQLTLLSSAASTASVADITNNNVNTGNNIAGKIVIERYIPAKRAWRLLTAPVTAASQVKMNTAWQEGAACVTNPAIINSANNPNPGYGTHITFGNPAANGYDQGPNGNTSICYLTTTGWNGVPTGTNGTALNAGYITDQPGYMLFVRGDRSTLLSSATSAATTATTLRIKGIIITGLQNIALGTSLVIGASKFRIVGNPYPSAVNFHKLIANSGNTGAGFSDAFYMWDPSITGTNGVGGWVAMNYNSSTGVYDRNVVSSSINSNGDIQSGAAFLIDYTGSATNIQVKESNKTTASNNSQFRPLAAGQVNQLRVTLLAKNADNTTSVNDGLLVNFDDTYSNVVDNADMKKIANFAENFALLNDQTALVIEKRKTFLQSDTIHFKMTKMKQKNYQLEFGLDALNTPEGTTAILEDKFLGAKTVLDMNKTSSYNFTINGNTASADAERFKLLFKQAAEFATIAGSVKEKDAIIEWGLNEEFNLSQYEVERSTDGIIFSTAGTVFSEGNSNLPVTYSWTDIAPSTGNYVYRIKAVSKNGVAVYSNKVNIKIIDTRAGMYVFPNPVTGSSIQLQINKMPGGIYNAKLTTVSGEQIADAVIQHQSGSSTKLITLPSGMATGMYLLQVTDATGKVTIIRVVVQKN